MLKEAELCQQSLYLQNSNPLPLGQPLAVKFQQEPSMALVFATEVL